MKTFLKIFCCTILVHIAMSNSNSRALAAGQPETRVYLETNYGKVILRIYNSTPLHRDNFVKLVREGFYDGLLFHRVIKDFMIQGGDPESKTAIKGAMLGNGGPGYTIPAEFVDSLIHRKGALAAARLGDGMNPKKESSGSQFYIVHGRPWTEADLAAMESRTGRKYSDSQKKIYREEGGAPHLDGGYTVFGQLDEGFGVLDRIAATPTGGADRPSEDVRILKAGLVK
jgi:peptidyl-prolyl cis-trans isomerase B (cyclophilin B)